MLTIRRVQEAAFQEASDRQFQERLLVHVRTYFRVDYELLGEAQIRKVIEHGLRSAARHGLQTRGQCCRYLDLILALGSHFDRDPLLPWAAAALTQGASGTRALDLGTMELGTLGEAGFAGLDEAARRMDRLDELALDYLERLMGPDGGHYRRAMLRGRKVSYGDLALLRQEPRSTLARLLERIHPEKYRQTSPSNLDAFFRFATRQARRHGLAGDHAATLFLGLAMFMLGSHFTEDPLYPWAEAALGHDGVVDPRRRGLILYEATMAHLDRALDLVRGLKVH